jgi:hypothetical protein
MARVDALGDEMREARALVFTGGLHRPSRSRVARLSSDRVVVTDGPYAESKEHIGGFWVLEVEDLDAALGWARKATRATTLPIEVRPFQHGGAA